MALLRSVVAKHILCIFFAFLIACSKRLYPRKQGAPDATRPCTDSGMNTDVAGAEGALAVDLFPRR
ncbi:hypothetical protein D5041_10965 [Verminephrobacter aporrectodeae subsp. tuberculatae]|nr:hypothetical protein [Verminephrobacter aporrectodeae subsp. tuberculatae]MCW5289554.1 hypothetical protein [Verminephrobacter aporrectodeae subsp. tuberculatae]